MSMFCPNCKSLMFPKDGMMVCKKCEIETAPGNEEDYTIKQAVQEKELKIMDDDLSTMPTTQKNCPSCGHNEASFVIRQMRAADEPPTAIYRCIKCRHTWREQ